MIKAGYKQTEVGVIPEDWEVCCLGDAVDFLDNLRRPVKSSDREKINGIYPYYGASGIVDYVNNYIFDEELILLGEDGENILSRNLPLAFRVKGKIWVNNHAHVLKPKDDFNIGYLSEFLESLNYSLLNSGTAQPKLNKQSCLKIKVAQPTKTEQNSIAKALSDTDALIQSLSQLIAKKRQIKQGAMQNLLNPYDETGALKVGWVVKELDDLASFSKGKGLPKSELVLDGKYECIHYGELFTKYKENINSILNTTNSKVDSFLSQVNDVLMPTSDVTPNGLATASCLKTDEVILGGDILVIRPYKDLLDGVFFAYLVNLERNQVMQLVTGSTVYHLYGSDMAKFKFGMPSKIEEQAQTAQILTDMDTEITTLETKLSKYQKIKQGMMQNLLTGRIRLVTSSLQAGKDKTS